MRDKLAQKFVVFYSYPIDGSDAPPVDGAVAGLHKPA